METIKSLLVSAFFIAFFGLSLVVIAAPAGAHCAGKHGDGHPHCDDGSGGGGDGGTVPEPVSLDVIWGGEFSEGELTEKYFRICDPHNFTPNGNSGNYQCDMSGENPVEFNLAGGGVQTARKGDKTLCEAFDNSATVTLEPNSSYQFYWFGPCGDTCSIEIYNWFGGEQAVDATGGQADFIRVTAWAVAEGPFTNSNPFVEPHDLEIDRIEISFYANGSNKRLATCEYSDEHSNLGEVTFSTSPVN